jgi:hypothetical protein
MILVASGQATAGAREDSETWIKMGVKMRLEGDHAGALEAFLRAHHLNPSTRTMGQIGLARQSLHDWTRAANSLELALGSSDAWVDKNRKYLEDALAMVKSHIGWLLVAGPEGSDLYVDESGAGTLPLQGIQVDEGEHEVRVAKVGMKSWSTTAKIMGGKTTEITTPLEAEVPRLASPVPTLAIDVTRPAPAKQMKGYLPICGAGLVGAGLSLAAVGTVVWIQQERGNYGSFDSGPTGPLLVAGGVVGALAGGVMVYLFRDRPVAVGANAYGPTVSGRF